MSSRKQFILLLAILSQTASSFTTLVAKSANGGAITRRRSLAGCSRSSPLAFPGLLLAAAAGDDDDENDEDFVKVPRRRQRGRFFDNEEEEDDFYDRVEHRVYTEDDDWEDDDDEDYDDEEEDDYGLFSNVLIDNPLLDSIDPDGAAERFPELARDPWFWIDMLLFFAFLNFLSSIGPQDYFPDLPWYPDGSQIGTAGS
eukprot:scaffold5407_cov132-Cylindrotheca_fusiformis.AAC.5